MRTKSAQAQAVIDNPSHSARVIVWVADSAGALQELTASDITYGAPLHLDTVASLTVEESVDTPRVANIALNFQQGLFSRSPLNVTGSNPLQTAAASIFVGREVLIECIVTPADGNLDLGSGCRMTLFNGYIDSTAFPENQLELVCTDRTAKLRDTWIEKERLYGFCTGAFATKGAFVYRNDLILGVGDLIVPSKLNMNGHFYRVTGGAGAIGATEPVWPTGAGAVVASGFLSLTESGATSTAGIAVETIMQQILTDNGIAETMITPVSPTWLIYPYLQGRTSVLDALKQFSTQLGWRLAFMWNAGAAAFRLTFQAPDRARITVDKAIAANDETRCSDLSIDVFGIRNVVRVTYGNAAARDNDGIPRREFVERTNAASVTKYGRRYMEVTEADTSNIDSPSEGATLAQAVVDDLAEPTVGAGIDCPIDPFVEIGDMIQLPADGRRMSSAQLLACESMRFSFAGESARSSFVVRGKPSAGRLTWLALDGKRKEKQDDIHLTTMLDSLAPSQLLASLVGGQSVKIGNADVALGGKRHGTTEHELHVSATAGFVPSPSTKRGPMPAW